jgi:hypothetical protein
MLIDKQGLIDVLTNTCEEIKVLPNHDYYLDMKLIAIESSFADRTPALMKILEKAAQDYVIRKNPIIHA